MILLRRFSSCGSSRSSCVEVCLLCADPVLSPLACLPSTLAEFNLLLANDLYVVVLLPPRALVALFFSFGVSSTLPPSLKVGVPLTLGE